MSSFVELRRRTALQSAAVHVRACALPAMQLRPLRCPGGPRISSSGIKTLFNVPNAGYLAKYDQRFILNLKLTHQIMAHLSKTNKTHDKLLVELGPGAGALTRSLLTRPCIGVLGIEVDPRFNALLQQVHLHTAGKFQWKTADILKVDEFDLISTAFPNFAKMHERRPTAAGGGSQALKNAQREELLRKRRNSQSINGVLSSTTANSEMLESEDDSQGLAWWSNGDAKVEVVGNLPFSVITELIMRYAVDCSLQRGLYRFGRVPLHVFVQKEVAERLAAVAGSPHFSRLSVLCQNFFRVAVRQTFTEMTYYPRTEVLGCLVTLEPRVNPLVNVSASVLIHFTDILMHPGMRNKMIVKALNRCVPEEVSHYITQELRIDGSIAPCQLNTAEIARMALLWQKYLEASNQKGQVDEHEAKQASREFITNEERALSFDWQRHEAYAIRQREKAANKKTTSASEGQQRQTRRSSHAR